jgi:hypothetical protein
MSVADCRSCQASFGRSSKQRMDEELVAVSRKEGETALVRQIIMWLETVIRPLNLCLRSALLWLCFLFFKDKPWETKVNHSGKLVKTACK